MSNKKSWFFLIDGQENGPVASTELMQLVKNGKLKLTDKVRKGKSEWRQISKIPKLAAVAGSQSTAQANGTGLKDPSDNESGNFKSPKKSIWYYLYPLPNSESPDWMPRGFTNYVKAVKCFIAIFYWLGAALFLYHLIAGVKFEGRQLGMLDIILAAAVLTFFRNRGNFFANKFLEGDRQAFMIVNIFLGLFAGCFLLVTPVVFLFEDDITMRETAEVIVCFCVMAAIVGPYLLLARKHWTDFEKREPWSAWTRS